MKKRELLMVILTALLLNGCTNKELSVESTQMLKNTKVSEQSNHVELSKVTPEIAVLTTKKLEKGEVPVIIVNPVSANTPVKEVDILPVVDDTVGIVTKVAR